MKGTFYLDTENYQFLRGVLIGARYQKPQEYSEAALIMNNAVTFDPIRGTQFELSSIELELLLDATSTWHRSLVSILSDQTAPAIIIENARCDFARIQVIFRSIASQGLDNGLLEQTKFGQIK